MSPASATFFTTVVAVFSMKFCSAAPTTNLTTTNEVEDVFPAVYDQRQNGSENVRVNVKDVFLVWAPEENSGILDSDFLDYPNEEVPQISSGANEVEKPTSIIDILNSFQELAASSSSTASFLQPVNTTIGSAPSSTTEIPSSTATAKAKRFAL